MLRVVLIAALRHRSGDWAMSRERMRPRTGSSTGGDVITAMRRTLSCGGQVSDPNLMLHHKS
jgi:hypothetical protein